jgi:hypothetical protein
MSAFFSTFPTHLSAQLDPRLPGEPFLFLMHLDASKGSAWVLRVGPFKVFLE